MLKGYVVQKSYNLEPVPKTHFVRLTFFQGEKLADTVNLSIFLIIIIFCFFAKDNYLYFIKVE